MRWTRRIDDAMFAPCGVNCSVCYRRVNPRKKGKTCQGCRAGEATDPTCRKCRIKDCLAEKNLAFCFECESMPCKRVKNLDKTYRDRYNVSLVENLKTAGETGVTAFLRQEKKKWTCPSCHGILSLHDGICSECKEVIGNRAHTD